jgi:MYXO-CTERM domain-containing protein
MYGDPGYDGVLGDPMNMAMNALKGRQGFAGTSASYPMLQTTKVDMGTSLAGKTVKVRFRVGSDDAQGASGWDIDNITFAGITNKPFPALVDDKSTCDADGGMGTGGGMGAGGGGGSTSSGGVDAGADGGDGVLTAGDGCDCNTTGGTGSSAGAAAALLALAGLLARRRRG